MSIQRAKRSSALLRAVLCNVGLKILSVYMSGSKNMSYDSASLTTPDIKWLGVRPSDLIKYNIPEQCKLQMKESDMKTGRDLLEEDFIKKNPEWTKV